MPNTPRMSWTFPSENQNPFFDRIAAFFGQQDASAYAAREDRHIILRGGGTVSFSMAGGTLAWNDDFELLAAITGFKWRIEASSIQLLDGEIAYVDLVRAPSNNAVLLPQKGSQIPSTDTAHVLCVRIGSRIYFFNGASVADGSPASDIGAGGGGGGGGGGGAVEILDEGGSLTADVASIDFVGSGVIASTVGDDVTVTIPSAGGAPQYAGSLRRQEIDDLLLATEVKLGGFTLDPALFSGATFSLSVTLALTDAGGTAPDVTIRLYDMGAPGAPIAPVLRSDVSTSTVGELVFLEQVLTLDPAPGVNVDEIHDSTRIYEVRAELAGDAGDFVEIDWAGVLGT